jgi:hypothetical protein
MFFTTIKLLWLFVLALLTRLLRAAPTAYLSGIWVFFYKFFPPGRDIVTLPTPGMVVVDVADALAGATKGAADDYRIDKI